MGLQWAIFLVLLCWTGPLLRYLALLVGVGWKLYHRGRRVTSREVAVQTTPSVRSVAVQTEAAAAATSASASSKPPTQAQVDFYTDLCRRAGEPCAGGSFDRAGMSREITRLKRVCGMP